MFCGPSRPFLDREGSIPQTKSDSRWTRFTPQMISADYLSMRRIFVVLSLLGTVMLAQDNRPADVSSPAPAFADDFSGGTLDKSKWFIDTGGAPGNISSVNQGTFSADHVDLSTGMLRLKLTQSVSGSLATSVGSEIRSKQLFGYGTSCGQRERLRLRRHRTAQVRPSPAPSPTYSTSSTTAHRKSISNTRDKRLRHLR